MKYVLSIGIVMFLASFAAVAVAADFPVVTGVLAPTPVQEHSCVAVEILVEPGQPVHGVQWYHNDSTVMFPRLLLIEGAPQQAPDLTQTSMVLADLSGDALDWGEVYFAAPVTSSSGVINVVFEMPAWTERTAMGDGGGPGLGYVDADGEGNAWVSREGAEWTRLHGDYQVAVTPILGGAARAMAPPQSLATLAGSAPEGWWTDVAVADHHDTYAEDQAVENIPQRVSAESPLRVTPNPFNPRTEIWYYVAEDGPVTIDVYDLRGRRVNRLVSSRMPAGEQSIIWQGDDHGHRQVASGVYFVRVKVPQGTFQQRVTLVR